MNSRTMYCKDRKKLIEIVEENCDMLLIQEAMLELSYIVENYALAKGMEFLKNNEYDAYFQACIFDFIYDLNKEKVLDCILSRASDIDFYLFKEILTMLTHTAHEDFTKMKKAESYLNFLLEQYNTYSEAERNELHDLLGNLKEQRK